VPSFSYLITDMLLFENSGTMLLIAANEHGEVQLFDFETGMFLYKFEFEHVFKVEFKKKKKVPESSEADKDPSKTLPAVKISEESSLNVLSENESKRPPSGQTKTGHSKRNLLGSKQSKRVAKRSESPNI
jgi:hypothetical protein